MAIIPAQDLPFRMRYALDGIGSKITLKVVSGEGQQSSGTYDLKAPFKQNPETAEQIPFGTAATIGVDKDLQNYRLSVLVQVLTQVSKKTAVTVELSGGTTVFSQTFEAVAPNVGDIMSYEFYFRLVKPD